MNRLRGLRTYLSGAIDRHPDEGVQWRQKVTPMLNRRGVVVLNPLNKPFEMCLEDEEARRLRHISKQNGDYDKVVEFMKPIRNSDLRMVDMSDFLVVSIDVQIHACGTYEEVDLANRQKKPVLIWCQQGKKNTPDWLFGMIPHQHMFDTIEGVMSYLDQVDTADQLKTYNRWQIPVFNMLYNSDVLGSLVAS